MDIFDVLSMVGGLALFLYGMHIMGDALAKMSGGKLEKFSNALPPISGLLCCLAQV